MSKLFSRVLIALVLIVLLLMVVGAGVRKNWGKDVRKVEVKAELALSTLGNKTVQFAAERDRLGVWELHASNVESLSFAFGYVHALDREFQTELLRRAATGRMSSLFGEPLLEMDRLLRLLVYPSKDEWKRVQKEDPDLARAAEFYVAGRKEYLRKSQLPLPVEYRFFGLTREDSASWEPWELLAIARLNAWQFSSDHRGELVRFQLREFLNTDLASLLTPQEPKNSGAAYDQVLAKDFVKAKNRMGAINGEALKRLLSSAIPESLNSLKAGHLEKEKSVPEEKKSASLNDFDASGVFEHSFETAEASNAWLIQDPRVGRPLSLCNDPHLEFTFPSALYPVKYSLKMDAGVVIRGTGFSFPGLPFVALGQLEKVDPSQTRPFVRSFGITSANYADTQDLVKISEKTLKEARVVEDEFEIYDPLTAKKSTKKVQYQWTRFGPRVDQILDWQVDVKAPPLALDWLGFKKLRSPIGFFLRQNLFLGKSVREDLARYWDFPSVNLTFIESNFDGTQRASHVVTGNIFTSPSLTERSTRREFASEEQALKREYTDVGTRPYFEVFPSNKETFFLVSANQRVWSGDFGLRSGFEWMNGHRADSIVENFDKLISAPEFAQTNFYSRGIHQFVKAARARLNVDRLCGSGYAELFQPCVQLLASLDSWKGVADVNDWRPSVAFLWRNLFREKIFYPTGKKPTEKERKFFEKWNGSTASERAVVALLNDSNARTQYETSSRKNLDQMLTDSFSEALDLLVSNEGSLADHWTWGSLHTIRWRHPFAKLPKPMGPALLDSMLGVPPPVSGSEESPGTTVSSWSREEPTKMPATRGAVMRFCSEIDSKGQASLKWANVTGTSGNPFSEWSRKFADETWFKNRLLPARN